MNFNWIDVIQKQFGNLDNDRIQRANDVMVFNPIHLGIGATAELKTDPTNPPHIPSSKEGQTYRTTITVAASHCTCQDHKLRHVACKHLIRLARLMSTMSIDVDINPLPSAFIDAFGEFELGSVSHVVPGGHKSIVIGTEYRIKPVTIVTGYEVE